MALYVNIDDELNDDGGGIPDWQKRKDMIPEIKKTYKDFKSLLWKARMDGDGSFGLKQASEKLDECYMWALKDLKGADNEDF